jgi:hypothetical protein
MLLNEEMPSRKNIHCEPFHVRGELPPSLHHSLVGAGVLGASEGDEAEGEGRKWSVNVVVAAKKVEGKGGIRQKVECGATDT